MINCKNCGKQVNDEAQFCSHCGNRIANPAKIKRGKSNNWISKIIMVLVTALILVGSFVKISNDSEDIGYVLGSIETKNAKYKTIIGVYLAKDDKYGSLTLVINEDGTCNDSFGNPGTWTKEDNIFTFVFDTFTKKGIIDPETCIIYYEDRLYQKIS